MCSHPLFVLSVFGSLPRPLVPSACIDVPSKPTGGCALDAKCPRRSQSLIVAKAPTHGRFFFFPRCPNRPLPELKAVTAEAHLSEPPGGVGAAG